MTAPATAASTTVAPPTAPRRSGSRGAALGKPPVSDPTRQARLRLLLMGVFGVLWALALVLRLVDLQVMKRDFLADKAERQQERAIKLDALRGFILDRSGEVLAASTEVQSVFASPAEVKDKADAAELLASILGGEKARYAELLGRQGAFVWIKRKITEEQAAALAGRLPSGVFLMPESRRLYPKGSLAAHVLGYVGLDNDGLAGLERQYDEFVKGTPGLMLTLRNARGSNYRHWIRKAPVHGLDLTLTIDEVAQHIAEREAERCQQETKARGVSIVVLDPSSGRILAMAGVPTFDPNVYQEFSKDAWRNRAIADACEPGSTFKVFTGAAALEAGLVTPAEPIFCENGAIVVARTRIRDHDPYGTLSFREIIAKSSNVGAIKVGLRLPRSTFFKTIQQFGFGRRSLVDLPGESPGLLRAPEHWSMVSQASISMGQEIGVTPLQMCAAMSAIGNGGSLYRPFVVERVTGPDGATKLTNVPTVVGQPLSAGVAASLRDIMTDVVTAGTARAARIDGIAVAGKTGTAQKIVDGHYSHSKFFSSFVAFVPAEAPRLTIGVFVDEPVGKYYGGLVAAPTWKRVAEPLLRHLGISVGAGEAGDDWPRARDGSAEVVRVYLPDASLETRKKVPPAPATARTPTAVDGPTFREVALPATPGHVPDVTGRSLRDAVRMAWEAGLTITPVGAGLAVRQEPPGGTTLAADRPMTVYFEGS